MWRAGMAEGVGKMQGKVSWDLYTLARTLWGEAEGEGEVGMVAVAHVILNRQRAGGWFGATVAEVCLKPRQFSCWNMDSPRAEKMQGVTVEDPRYLLALRVACQALQGDMANHTAPDPTFGATHYHTTSVDPKWDDQMILTATIGNHRFYKPGVSPA
jgi:N-acetylmuramoyl-L-alanine amidase